MADIIIRIRDLGNDNVTADINSPKVENFLTGNIDPRTLVDLSGAEQLAVAMCRAAHQYLATIQAQQRNGAFKGSKKLR